MLKECERFQVQVHSRTYSYFFRKEKRIALSRFQVQCQDVVRVQQRFIVMASDINKQFLN